MPAGLRRKHERHDAGNTAVRQQRPGPRAAALGSSASAAFPALLLRSGLLQRGPPTPPFWSPCMPSITTVLARALENEQDILAEWIELQLSGRMLGADLM